MHSQLNTSGEDTVGMSYRYCRAHTQLPPTVERITNSCGVRFPVGGLWQRLCARSTRYSGSCDLARLK